MFLYGMKLRGFSIGCQPRDGFLERRDDIRCMYWDILAYSHKLSDSELKNYDLNYI